MGRRWVQISVICGSSVTASAGCTAAGGLRSLTITPAANPVLVGTAVGVQLFDGSG